MLIQLDWPRQNLRGQYVLKLFDRRFAHQLRKDEAASAWSPALEDQYRSTVKEGCALSVARHCIKREKDQAWIPSLEPT